MTHRQESREQSMEEHHARVQRILDAASALLMQHGYDNISVEDIARAAGVGKGTLYLHWPSREALFAALILREKMAMAEDLKRRALHDPQGATLQGMLKHAALALLHRPVLKATLLRDTAMFGRYIQREQHSDLSREVLSGFTDYLTVLQEQGWVRTDLPLKTVATLFSSIFLGFFLAAPLIPEAFASAASSDEDLAELIAETGHRTLEPRAPGTASALDVVSNTFTGFLDQSIVSAEGWGVRGTREVEGGGEKSTRDDQLRAVQIAKRARGRQGGRPRKLTTAEQLAEARRLYADRTLTIGEICSALGISRASFYRYMRNTGAH